MPDRRSSAAGSAGESGKSPVNVGFWGDAPRGIGFVFAAGALFFVAYSILSLINGGFGPLKTGLGLVALILFAMLVGPRFRGRPADRGRAGWRPVALVVAMTALAATFTLATPDRGEGVALFFFAGLGSAFLRPDRRALAAIAGVAGVNLVVTSVSWGNPEGAIPIAIEIGFISLTVYGVGILRRTNLELVQAQHDLARLAVAEERVRIARDLHDTLGQSLTLIALKAELVERLVEPEPARARAEAADVRRAAREALASVRETVSGYRQPELKSEIEGVRAALAVAGIDARIDLSHRMLPSDVDAVLAWAVREAGTNVLRHSGAKHAAIAVGADGDLAYAEVTDDGPPRQPAPRGSGLAGLAERVASYGGSLEAGPRSEGGYRLRVTVPLAPRPGETS